MAAWTVKRVLSGRVRYSPDTGGMPRFAQFEYAITPAIGEAGVVVTKTAQGDANLGKWFPSIKAGLEGGCQCRMSAGEPLAGLQIEITKVVAHPRDTDDLAMRSAGRLLLWQIEHELQEVDNG
jgi:hypothetical protein